MDDLFNVGVEKLRVLSLPFDLPQNEKAALLRLLAGTTRLELATSCVTGRRSNQTELHPPGTCRM